MKSVIHFSDILPGCCLGLLMLLSACGGYTLDEENGDNGSGSSKEYQMSLKVRSRNGSSDQQYPLAVYLFDAEGKLVEQTLLNTSEETFQRTLAKGEYTLTAFSGLSQDYYDFPESPKQTDLIQLKGNGTTASPLLMGQSRVQLTGDTQVTLALSYAVSALNLTVQDVPEEAESVEACISPVSSAISFAGNYSNDGQAYNRPCTLSEQGWTTGTFYLFPAQNSRTNLSVTVGRTNGNETYSYTYEEGLEAARPYQFTGNWQGGVSMGGTFEIEGWKASVNVNFSLNGEQESEGETQPDTETSPDETVLLASELPIAECIWGYFYVWKVEEVSETEVIATLISPDQWWLLAEDGPQQIESYSIDGLDGWRTFTGDEIKEFSADIGLNMAELNKYLNDNGLDRFYESDGARYLCDNCLKTYSFSTGRLIDAGKTVKYYLRGVKTVRVKLNEGTNLFQQ